MHADIVLGVDDLSIQNGEGPATAPRGEGQEVRGFGGGPTKEAAQRHGGGARVSILRTLGPGQGSSGPAGGGRGDHGQRHRCWAEFCPGPGRIPVTFGSCWHPTHPEPPGAQPTTGHWHRSTVRGSHPHITWGAAPAPGLAANSPQLLPKNREVGRGGEAGRGRGRERRGVRERRRKGKRGGGG